MDCLFCAIAAGDIPCSKVYEDDQTLAFLDIQPLARGHTLVIPKTHAAHLEDCEAATATALIQTVQKILPSIREATGAQDSTIAINNGPHAGQEVPHVHVHIVPRFENDASGPIHALFSNRPDMGPEALAEMAASMQVEA